MRAAKAEDVAARLRAAGFKAKTAAWCGFCKKLKKDFEDAGLNFDEFNLECDKGGPGCEGVTGFPTLMIKGSAVPGYKPLDAILALL